MEPSQPQHLASWNPERDVWEGGQMDLFSGLSGVYSETWPASGMTRSGTAYELPTSVPPTSGTASSSLPTPRATRGGSSTETVDLLRTPMANEAEKGWVGPRLTEWHQEYLSNQVSELLPTPTVNQRPNRSASPGAAVRPSLEGVAKLLPTPQVAYSEGGHLSRSGDRSGELLLPGVAQALGEGTLLPTPTTRDWKGGGPQANVPTNSLPKREIWDLPEGWSLHRGDTLFVEDSTQTVGTATSTSESDTPGAGSSPPSDAGN